MTSLRQRKTKLSLETDSMVFERGRQREVIVEPEAGFCTVRLKGTQRRYFVAWGSIYAMGVKIQVEKERQEKKDKRRIK